ncbi:MAG: 1,4-dihydroxy-2-naphthoate polyprenyltransferase [Corynebacterium sp.]|nr:1,4-dihydroxy-2-naphthoate polyprenyltransferase [Corynebacterium sp.]
MSQQVRLKHWIAGARPRTWANAFAPVIMGTGVAAYYEQVHWGQAALALIVAWSFIIGVNYANDYSDGIRGTDEDRSGPLRLTGSGLARPQQVRTAAFLSLGIGGIAGIILAAQSSWWLVLVGLVCMIAAWTYTGGKNPYGYKGYGEVSVFVFFGLVAVNGTAFAQTGSLSWVGLWTSIAIGACSAAVNLANNLRDIPTDQANGKITLAVKLGDTRTRSCYQALVATPLVMSVIVSFATSWVAVTGFLAAPFAWIAAQPVRSGAQGKELIPVLASTGRVLLVWAIVTSLALAF